MKKMIKCSVSMVCALTISLWVPLAAFADSQPAQMKSLQDFLKMPIAKNEVAFLALGPYSNIVVRAADKTVLFDPSKLNEAECDALNKHGVHLVVYTHEHSDHFSSSTAIQLYDGSQPYMAVESFIAPFLKDTVPGKKMISTVSGQSYTAGTIHLDTLSGKHVGEIMLFRINIDGINIFHGGDSAHVPLETMTSDIAFVPTGSPSPTCSPEYAVQMVTDIKPQVAVAMHGWEEDHEGFKKQMTSSLPKIKVIIPKPYVGQKVLIRK